MCQNTNCVPLLFKNTTRYVFGQYMLHVIVLIFRVELTIVVCVMNTNMNQAISIMATMLNQTQNKGFLFVLNVLLANLRKPAKCIFLCSLGSHFTLHISFVLF